MMSSFPHIPSEFFEDMESSWNGRIKRIHIADEIAEVGRAAEALSLAVSLNFGTVLLSVAYIFAYAMLLLT